MNCNCGEAKLVTVKKEGPNTGRQFYACAKPQGSQCDFFCWEGETPRAVKARVPSSNLQSTALAQIQVQLNRIEENQKKLGQMLASIGGTLPTPLANPEGKILPF